MEATRINSVSALLAGVVENILSHMMVMMKKKVPTLYVNYHPKVRFGKHSHIIESIALLIFHLDTFSILNLSTSIIYSACDGSKC